MKLASGEFAEDPCSSMKRGNMVRAARALLSAVTHLLVLADMSDVYKLLLQLKLVNHPYFWLHRPRLSCKSWTVVCSCRNGKIWNNNYVFFEY